MTHLYTFLDTWHVFRPFIDVNIFRGVLIDKVKTSESKLMTDIKNKTSSVKLLESVLKKAFCPFTILINALICK